MELANLLSPLLPEHLGVLAIGCLCSDAPARPGAVRQLLQAHFGLEVREDVVADVILRVAASRPRLLANCTVNESVLQPRSIAYSSLFFKQFVPVHWNDVCIVDRGLLVRVATIPTVCFTLSFGMRAGEVILLRCSTCGAMYAGPWCWTSGGDAANFPDGNHHPRGATTNKLLESSRWFFATPQACWETSLLHLFLLLAARGGVSWSALFVVYSSLFGSTLAGTKYAQRTHFVTSLEMAEARICLSYFMDA